MTYDSVPVIHIMLRHRKIFENEEKETTEVVMGSGRDDTTIMNYADEDRDNSRMMTLRNLEQLRLSTVVGTAIPRLSTLKRTVVHEEREQMLALIERDDNRSQSSGSVNESSFALRSIRQDGGSYAGLK